MSVRLKYERLESIKSGISISKFFKIANYIKTILELETNISHSAILKLPLTSNIWIKTNTIVITKWKKKLF